MKKGIKWILLIFIILVILRSCFFVSLESTFVLSHEKPRNKIWGIELVAISNQTATIKIIKTGEVVSANKGNHFKCLYYKERLYLKNISGDKGEAELSIRF